MKTKFKLPELHKYKKKGVMFNLSIGFCTFVSMTFYDKYPQLKQRQYLFELLCKMVYATMALEDQTVPMRDVEKIVDDVISEQELRQGQLFLN